MPQSNTTSNRCYKCGKADHTTSRCGLKHRVCFQCHEPGHESKACPLRYQDRTCEGCGQKGHISEHCPDRESWICKNCALSGHGHWECTKPKEGRRRRCHQCHGLGHTAVNCENRLEPRSKHPAKIPSHPTGTKKQKQERPCVLCWGEHASVECFLVPCAICGRNGHQSAPCSENSGKPVTPPPESSKPLSYQKPTENTANSQQYSLQQKRRERGYSLWGAAEYELHDDDDDRALALLMKAIELEPHEPKPTYTLQMALDTARCRFLLGSPSSALLAVDIALSINGADEDALSLRRRILQLDGYMVEYREAVAYDRWGLARTAYESCLAVYAQECSNIPAQIRCWGVELLVAEGKVGGAIKTVEVLLQEVSNDVDAMTLCALALFLDAKPLEALDQLVAVLKLDPDNGRAKALRDRVEEVVRLKGSGDEAFEKNDYHSAITSWTEALAVLGERASEGRGGYLRASLLLNRATGLRKVRKFAEGLKDIDECLQLCPEYPEAFLCLDLIEDDLEQFETAAEDFRATLKNGKASSNGMDKRGTEAELEGAERRAKLEKIKEQDHYATLGLAASCTAIDVKKAYRTLSLKHHPDRGGVAEKFSQIAHAYAVLSDPDQKRAYDAKLQSPSPGPSTQPMQSGSWWEHHFRKGPDLRTVY